MVTMQSAVIGGGWVAPLDGLRQAMLLESAAEIVPGDWLRDLGTLREVKSVEALPADGVRGETLIVRFESQPDVADYALGIRAGSPLTVWRTTGSGTR